MLGRTHQQATEMLSVPEYLLLRTSSCTIQSQRSKIDLGILFDHDASALGPYSRLADQIIGSVEAMIWVTRGGDETSGNFLLNLRFVNQVSHELLRPSLALHSICSRTWTDELAASGLVGAFVPHYRAGFASSLVSPAFRGPRLSAHGVGSRRGSNETERKKKSLLAHRFIDTGCSQALSQTTICPHGLI